MSSPFRDESGAAHARVEQLEAQVEELAQENVRLRTRVAPTSTGDLAGENARLREENGLLRVALESKRRELAKRSPARSPDFTTEARGLFFLVVFALFVLAIIMSAIAH